MIRRTVIDVSRLTWETTLTVGIGPALETHVNAITNRIQLTTSEIQARFDAIGAGCDIEVDDITITNDTIEDFQAARSRWNDQGKRVESPDGTLVVRQAQAAKGQQREDIYVVDFGDVRLVWKW